MAAPGHGNHVEPYCSCCLVTDCCGPFFDPQTYPTYAIVTGLSDVTCTYPSTPNPPYPIGGTLTHCLSWFNDQVVEITTPGGEYFGTLSHVCASGWEVFFTVGVRCAGSQLQIEIEAYAGEPPSYVYTPQIFQTSPIWNDATIVSCDPLELSWTGDVTMCDGSTQTLTLWMGVDNACCSPHLTDSTILYATYSGFADVTCGGVLICASYFNGLSITLTWDALNTTWNATTNHTCASGAVMDLTGGLTCNGGVLEFAWIIRVTGAVTVTSHSGSEFGTATTCNPFDMTTSETIVACDSSSVTIGVHITE